MSESSHAAVPPSPIGRGAGGEGLAEPARSPKPALPADLLLFARELRRTQTDAESLMWLLLRGRRLLGFKFRRQHPVPPYVLDFYCDELLLAVELDGGQHNEGSAAAKDQVRTEFLQSKGITVARYWNPDVLAHPDEVLEDLYRRMESARPSPAASRRPLPVGEGSRGAR
jgi:very-short-patch-repair endonuclease